MSARQVSVCMATYNGAHYVRQQIESILDDIEPEDEVVVVDDGSSDGTAAVVRDIRDSRVRLVETGENRGHVRAFETAMTLAGREVLMLADQDDLWPSGRRGLLVDALAHADVAAGNYETFGAARAPRLPLCSSYDGRSLGNLVGLLLGRRPYLGSCMAVRRDFLSVLLPLPRAVEAHDHWIAIAGNVAGRVAHVESPVTLRRIHADNLTPASRRTLVRVACTRLRQAALMLIALRRRPRAAATRESGGSADA